MSNGKGREGEGEGKGREGKEQSAAQTCAHEVVGVPRLVQSTDVLALNHLIAVRALRAANQTTPQPIASLELQCKIEGSCRLQAAGCKSQHPLT